MENDLGITDSLLVIEALRKQYPGFTLENVSLSVPQGSIIGLVGENGAGKSTILKAILGLVRPDAGSISLMGRTDYSRDAIGFIPEELWLYGNLRVKSLFTFLSKIYSGWDRAEACHLLQQLGIDENSRIKTLSKGNRTRLFLVTALSHRADLFVMDEPLSSLDPLMREHFWKLLEEGVRHSHKAALISSHLLYDLEEHCDYIAILRHGQIAFHGPVNAISKQWSKFVFNAPDGTIIGSSINTRKIGPASYSSVLAGPPTQRQEELTALGARDIRMTAATLHDLFIHMADGEDR